MLEKLIRKVDEKDVAILRVLDGLRGSFEFVLLEKLKEKLPYSEELIKERLRKLSSLKIVQARKQGEYIGFKILEKGMDIISVWNFIKHDKIVAILSQIGKGKESVLYSAIDKEKNWVVVKLHRYYTQEFKKIEKSLAYASIKLRGIELNLADYMIDVPRAKAQIEFHSMKRLYDAGINVPKPIDLDRHVVLMEMLCEQPGIASPLLRDVKLTNPKDALELIMDDYYTIINKIGLVHGDLSEFNIIVHENDLYYIDWPQAVPISYRFANKLIERDYRNIISYFKDKYKVETTRSLGDFLIKIKEEKKRF